MESSVSYYWEMDFLEFLKLLYSYNKFKVSMKGMRGSYVNNR